MQNIMNHFQILHMVVVRMETMQTIDKVTACHNWAWCLEHIYFVVEVHCAFMHAVVDDDVLRGFRSACHLDHCYWIMELCSLAIPN